MDPARTVRQRRRGQVLETAIFEATIAELGDVGYGRLTMEGIAARAGTAKSSLYRRWSSLEDLVVAAFGDRLPDPATLPESGELRGDLVAWLRLMADVLAGEMGSAVTAVLGELDRSPRLQRIAWERVLDPRMRRAGRVFERAAARGEIRAGAVTPFVVQAGPSMILQMRLLRAAPPSPRDIEDIVDQVILPILRPGPE